MEPGLNILKSGPCSIPCWQRGQVQSLNAIGSSLLPIGERGNAAEFQAWCCVPCL